MDDYLRFKKTSQLTRLLSAMLMLDNWFKFGYLQNSKLIDWGITNTFTQSSSPCFNVGLFTSKHTVTKNIMSVHRPSGGERLVPTNTRSQEPTCANLHYRSRLDHFIVSRSSNSQQAIQGTVIRSNRDGTSADTKN